MNEPDFLDEFIARRAARDPDFPRLVEEARRRLDELGGYEAEPIETPSPPPGTQRPGQVGYNRGRMPREMTDTEIQAFLNHGTRTAKLATALASGAPHVMPVWFVLDGDQLVFTTHAQSAKGRNLLRDGRVAVLVDDEVPPFAFVHIRGTVTISEDADELLRVATAIGGRYMGAERAEEFGRRNAVPGELVVRVRPVRVISETDVAGYG